MEEAIEMIEADAIKRGLQKGLQEGIRTIISNMLKKGISVDEIEELTGISKRKIEAIKKESCS